MTRHPVSLLICALGGEGGGVLTEWLVDTARLAGYAAQSTSIPGVAQRTGATTYYVEVFPVPIVSLNGRRPVFSLNPVAGMLDAIVSSELLETARQVANGMSAPERTQVITSSSRTLTTQERMQLGDGRADAAQLLELVRSYSREHHVFDMAAVANECGTIVSAVMLGAIAGCGLFPFSREQYEEVVRGSGSSAKASLRGFARGFDRLALAPDALDPRLRGDDAQISAPAPVISAPTSVISAPSSVIPAPTSAIPAPTSVIPAPTSVIPAPTSVIPAPSSAIPAPSSAIPAPTSVVPAPTSVIPAPTSVIPAPTSVIPAQAGIQGFPSSVHETLALGRARMLEYQSPAYAELYIERLHEVLAAETDTDPQGAHGFETTREMARWLALWMAFDDIVRVADLKSRASRWQRVKREVKAADDDLLKLYDHFKPGVPEFAALLPQSLATRLVAWDRRRMAGGKPAWALPLKIGTHSVFGMVALRTLASLKWLRAKGSRYAMEQQMIEKWVSGVVQGTRRDWRLGHEIALCGRLIKGYGATNERGKENLLHVLDHLALGDDAQACARAIATARDAALADDAGKALDAALTQLGAPPRPVKAVPIRFVRKPKTEPVAR